MSSSTSYFRPNHIADALSWLAHEGGIIAAGCTDLLPLTTSPELAGKVLDITAIEDMRCITDEGDHRRLGGATTWTDLIRADLPPAYEMLKLAAREIGSIQIQNAGTIAGNICNASPAADSVPCLLNLNASVELTSPKGNRVLPLEQFILGPRKTSRQPDEIVTAILIPKTAETGWSSFRKLGARKYLIISIAMTAARLAVNDGKITEAAISIGSCSPVAQRLTLAEESLIGRKISPSLSAEQVVSSDDIAAVISPIDDTRGTANYRIQAASVLVMEAIDNCLDQIRAST